MPARPTSLALAAALLLGAPAALAQAPQPEGTRPAQAAPGAPQVPADAQGAQPVPRAVPDNARSPGATARPAGTAVPDNARRPDGGAAPANTPVPDNAHSPVPDNARPVPATTRAPVPDNAPRTPVPDNAPRAPRDTTRPPVPDTTRPAAPVETAPPNVPEFRPAFPGQTRAPAVRTRAALQVTEVAGGFDKPWALAFLPDGRMLVTEKPTGRLYVVTAQGGKSPPVEGLPRVDGRDQGGLMDVALAPDFATSGRVYWSYYEPREGGNGLAVAHGRLVDGPRPRLEDVRVVFRMMPTLDSTKHAGGPLVFAPDGTLFVTLGERSILPGRVQAQRLDSHLGKVVRIRPDGAVPQDNPYVGRKDAKPEIWSSGHRNVLSAALDARGRLWVVEMGPRGGDELNLVQKGKDYGWPTIGYGEEYSGQPIHARTQAPGMEQPVYYWDPVISPSGMTLYSGDLFPEWKGNVFVGGLSSRALVRLVLQDDRVVGEERLLTERGARIRDVVQGPDGALWLLTDAADGKLLKVTPR